MRENNHNRLILNRIKEHYKLSNDTQLANFLGITSGTLSGWATNRGIGNWDLIFEKCENIDLNWLIKGSEVSHNAISEVNEPIATYNRKCLKCEASERLISKLEKENERLWKLIEREEQTRKQA
jgi:transcriptional regulator with XRE-family HTH domain